MQQQEHQSEENLNSSSLLTVLPTESSHLKTENKLERLRKLQYACISKYPKTLSPQTNPLNPQLKRPILLPLTLLLRKAPHHNREPPDRRQIQRALTLSPSILWRELIKSWLDLVLLPWPVRIAFRLEVELKVDCVWSWRESWVWCDAWCAGWAVVALGEAVFDDEAEFAVGEGAVGCCLIEIR